MVGDITAGVTVVFANGGLVLLSDGVGGNDCLSVTDPPLGAWLTTNDPGWDDCDNP